MERACIMISFQLNLRQTATLRFRNLVAKKKKEMWNAHRLSYHVTRSKVGSRKILTGDCGPVVLQSLISREAKR